MSAKIAPKTPAKAAGTPAKSAEKPPVASSYKDNFDKLPEKSKILFTPTHRPDSFKFSGYQKTEKPTVEGLPRAVALGTLLAENNAELYRLGKAAADLEHVRGLIAAQEANPHAFGKTGAVLSALDSSVRKEQQELRKLSEANMKDTLVLTKAIGAKKSAVVRGHPELQEARIASKTSFHGFANPMVVRKEYAQYLLNQKSFGLPAPEDAALRRLVQGRILSQDLVKNLICLMAIRGGKIVKKTDPDYVSGTYLKIPDDFRAIFPKDISEKVPRTAAIRFPAISSIISECIKDRNPPAELVALTKDPKKIAELASVSASVRAPVELYRKANPPAKSSGKKALKK